MFAPGYYARRYFPGRYFPPVVGATPPAQVVPDIKFALPNRSMNCTLSYRAMQFAPPKRNLNTTARQR
jgi:hypothetical protein